MRIMVTRPGSGRAGAGPFGVDTLRAQAPPVFRGGAVTLPFRGSGALPCASLAR